MTESARSKSAAKLPKSKHPWCLRCNKRVESVVVTPEPRHEGNFIVEYWCHGERVSQEMEAFELSDGLASYTAFNAYTSGLLPSLQEVKAGKKGGKK
jgi:hypothetical protein